MIRLLKRKQHPEKVGYFVLESFRVNSNAFFWNITVYEKVPKWFGLANDYKEVDQIKCGDKDYAMKQISEMSYQYDLVELLLDTRI